MHGFGSHTFSFINKNNERFFVKFHFKTLPSGKLEDARAYLDSLPLRADVEGVVVALAGVAGVGGGVAVPHDTDPSGQ